jgi:GrpB-like predicted nucleotidyltransferase (UPF0157 family)
MCPLASFIRVTVPPHGSESPCLPGVGQRNPNPVVEAFLAAFAEWARAQDDIAAVALVGSHARGSARLDSDVDLVILADDPELYLRDTAWTRRFGSPVRQQVEHYGRLTSIRAWYHGQLEVEFGIADRTWGTDAGARDVIATGIRVLFDHGAALPKETFDQKVSRVLAEEIKIVPYDPCWPDQFHEEKRRLFGMLPNELIRRIEHFGSTAVPGLAAKPVVDILVEVTELEATKSRIVPLLEAQGYDYFWRPNHRHVEHPYYAWFIARRWTTGKRTHHIHMMERDFQNWEVLFFRDYLIEHPDVAQEYLNVKLQLASRFKNDREAYTEGKGEFISLITERARLLYGSSGLPI